MRLFLCFCLLFMSQEYPGALRVALKLNDPTLVASVFGACEATASAFRSQYESKWECYGSASAALESKEGEVWDILSVLSMPTCKVIHVRIVWYRSRWLSCNLAQHELCESMSGVEHAD